MRADFKRELIKLLKKKQIEKDKRIRLFHFLYNIIQLEDEKYESELRKELLKSMGGRKDMDVTWEEVIINSPIFGDWKEAMKKEGEKEGQKKKASKIAQKLLKQGMKIEDVSKVTEVPVSELRKISNKD